MLFHTTDQYCKDPGDIENGYYVCEPSPTHCDLFKVGVRIRYVCNSGYESSGMVEQICLNGGKWSGLKVICKSGLCLLSLNEPNEKTILCLRTILKTRNG